MSAEPMSRRRWLNLAYLRPAAEGLSRAFGQAAMLQGRELQYLLMLERALRRLEIDEPFYPVRGAANSSYLYLLLRLITELPLRRVLELGAGESTVLLDRLAGHRPFHRITLEDQPEWLERVAQRVAEAPVLAPLRETSIAGRPTAAYDPTVLQDQPPFQLLLVDGPRGRRRFSRLGCLDLVEHHLAEEFVIVFDDAQRRGELDTIRLVLRRLHRAGVDVSFRFFHAAHSQCVIATPAFGAALHF